MPAWLRGKDHNEFEVYAVNADAFRLFGRVQTQWRSDGHRLIGLDYGVVLALMDRMRLDSDQQLDLLAQLSLIEAGYLNEVAEQVSRERRKLKKKVKTT